jgi:hypothetical protein
MGLYGKIQSHPWYTSAMSQFPHDRFNKNLFELRLSPFGEVSIQRSLDPKTTFIDIYTLSGNSCGGSKLNST